MKILVLGASGKTGTHVIQKALEQGYEVTAFVRSPATFQAPAGVAVVTGDARSETDIAKAMQGQDAVVSALGSMKAGDELAKQSAQAIASVADQTGVKRVVYMSSFLASPNYKPNFIGKLIGGMMKGMVNDKTSGEAVLKASDLDYTIVYATSLDKAKAGGTVRVVPDNEAVSMTNGISRADAADFMVKTLASPQSIRKSVVITVK